MFSVVDGATDALGGETLVWGIDLHNRSAHIGLALLPSFRGRGLSVDVIRVLSTYSFSFLGLNRLQIETGADNVPMLRAAGRAGFTHEGARRSANWVAGSFSDEAVFGLLATDWAS